MKQVIFNVGGALSSYIELDGKSIVVDLGRSNEYNPVIDFLVPLFSLRNKGTKNADKYIINQLIISHPHNDHLNSIIDFNSNFDSELLTCPNDNNGMPENHLINWDLIDTSNPNIIELRSMLKRRTPPLKSACNGKQFVYYIPPVKCETNVDLKSESYINNISLAVFFIINNHRVFMPGDLQKEGMKFLIENKYHLDNDSPLINKLKAGVDILIAPHHGLQSSFSMNLFDSIKDNKTRCLNIISEKVNTDDKRNVDTRYSSKEYCFGENNLIGGNGIDKCYQVKTSRGHIFIDYSYNKFPLIEIINDNEVLVKKFL